MDYLGKCKFKSTNGQYIQVLYDEPGAPLGLIDPNRYNPDDPSTIFTLYTYPTFRECEWKHGWRICIMCNRGYYVGECMFHDWLRLQVKDTNGNWNTNPCNDEIFELINVGDNKIALGNTSSSLFEVFDYDGKYMLFSYFYDENNFRDKITDRAKFTLIGVENPACLLILDLVYSSNNDALRNCQGWDFSNQEIIHKHMGHIDYTNANFQRARLMSSEITHSNMRQVNLRGADLSSAIMDETILLYADLEGICSESTRFCCSFLQNASLKGANLKSANLRSAELQYANLEGADLSSANLSWTDLTGANLKGANLTSANLSGAILKYADLTDAILEGTDFSDTRLSQTIFGDEPVFSKNKDNLTKFVNADLDYSLIRNNWSYLDLTNANIMGLGLAYNCNDLSYLNAEYAVLKNINLSGFILSNANFNHADLTGAELSGANLKNVSLQQAILIKAVLTNAFMESVNMNGAILGGLEKNIAANLSYAYLANAKLDSTNLYGVNFSYATFYGANASCSKTQSMEQVDFSNAYLAGIDLSNSDLRGARFDGACLVNVDLSGSDLTPTQSGSISTSFAGACLQGAIFSNTKLNHVNLTNSAISFDEGRIPVNRYNGHGQLVPPPPDAMPLNFTATTGLDKSALTQDTICPNGYKFEANRLKGLSIEKMLKAKNAPKRWRPSYESE